MQNTVLDEEYTLIAHYFPNQRVVDSIGYPIFKSRYDFEGTLEEWCKIVWKWEADYWNNSRFIFKHGCIPN